MSARILPPPHPGEILLEEFLKPLGLSQNKLSRNLGIPAQRINAIVRGQRAITVDTALRLARYFQTTPNFWLNLQNHYDLDMAQESRLTEQIQKEVATLELT
jgi:addiction module HigA family antidote